MNLTSTYLGLELRSPIVVSACPLSEDVANIVKMEDHGAGAVVLFSLFEEQIRRENALYQEVMQNTEGAFAEAADYFPGAEDYQSGTSEYLDLIRRAKERVEMPVIASLNGTSAEGWIEYAKQLEQAGADGIELNVFYIPADVSLTGEEVEQRYLDIVKLVKSTVSVPVAIKLNPYFSAMGNTAYKLAEAGADGLVFFNRFYQPDFDIENLRVISDLRYSQHDEIRLPLLWIAALHGRVDASIAATSGVQGAPEVVKYLLAGADAVMTASSLYRHGIEHLGTMSRGLEAWMQRLQFDSVASFRGVLSQQNIRDTTAYERANYIRIMERARLA
ncbi:MAG: dihydroorotate dehydrogenase-like protein [Gammaproteobacteria bacterium]|nr:dihydroorotate dehydrogenase-like protein [Gammaproteobacteria bacterium]